MRAGWNDREINAPLLARMVEDAGAAAVAVHGRTAEQSYKGESDWRLIDQVASEVAIPVFGSGDCVEAADVVTRLRTTGVSGVLVGRGALRNPWIFSEAAGATTGRLFSVVRPSERGEFLLEYIDTLLRERVGERAGFRHLAPGAPASAPPPQAAARGRERWVINKVRALSSWYTKGLEDGSRLRTSINAAESLDSLRQLISEFFSASPDVLAFSGK
jgi:tRNA-dihydrouridine synthase B